MIQSESPHAESLLKENRELRRENGFLKSNLEAASKKGLEIAMSAHSCNTKRPREERPYDDGDLDGSQMVPKSARDKKMP